MGPRVRRYDRENSDHLEYGRREAGDTKPGWQARRKFSPGRGGLRYTVLHNSHEAPAEGQARHSG